MLLLTDATMLVLLGCRVALAIGFTDEESNFTAYSWQKIFI